MNPSTVAERARSLEPWFYEFDLGQGVRTQSKLAPNVAAIHDTRRRMVEEVLTRHFGSRLASLRALDVGCHEGWFALALAELGVQEVLGIDVREESLEKARFVAEARGLEGLRFRTGDCEELGECVEGTYELTLAVGLLYHLENPMRCLRQLARHTSELMVLETQVIDEIEGSAEWGRRDSTMEYQGACALIDESFAFSRGNVEAGGTPLALCPSPRALDTMLHAAGFQRIEHLTPPADGYEQLVRGKRVVVAAYR